MNIHEQFLLNLQGARDFKNLWHIFLPQANKILDIPFERAELTYRSGILFEQLVTVNDHLTQKTLEKFSFADSKKDFLFLVNAHDIVLFKREDGDSAQVSLQVDRSTDLTAEPAIVKEEELTILTRMFFNHLYLLLKLKNYEFHSIKDDITLAYNQNYLKAFIQNEMERAKRYATSFSLIFFDLDNLKAINEVHGHLVGTEVLREVAGILRSQVRKVDLLSRFGGDEFVIVLLHAGPERAHEVSQRIRRKMNGHTFLKSKNLEINISGCFGISSFPENGNSVDQLIRKADLAMYEVKRKGKDGIKIFQEDEHTGAEINNE
jgi:diguanylate cyclase (GGDEF)-like protein